MPYILVRHTVEDFDKWKTIFDEDAPNRQAGGSLGGQLMQTAGNPNEVTVLLKWESLEKAQAFAQSDTLREAMSRAGVVGKPEVSFIEGAESLTI
ncbi:MAG TPA: antibiotic biosynthesis monooxygenase [Candidatus Kapabacteria bacterium]|nr:antibiotic biosynthesis monooxygenase [Candidatus Kapabacteria bacterium]